MALEGTLQEFGLSDIFQLIAIQQKTGVLSLRDGSDDVTVYFRGGDVVFADSRRRNMADSIGRLMVRSRMITADVLEQALVKQKQTLQRLGRILVDDGHITQEDLDRALELQVAQIVYRLFRWQVGDYRFRQEDELDLDRNHATLISAQHLLMEGVRMIDEWPMLERKISSMQMVFEKVDESLIVEALEEDKKVDLLGNGDEGEDEETALDDLDDLDVLAGFGGQEPSPAPVLSSANVAPEGVLRVSAAAAQLYQFVDGKTTAEDLVDCTLEGEFGTCRGLYELLEKKAIRALDLPIAEPAAEAPDPTIQPVLKPGWAEEAERAVSLVTGGAPDQDGASEAAAQTPAAQVEQATIFPAAEAPASGDTLAGIPLAAATLPAAPEPPPVPGTATFGEPSVVPLARPTVPSFMDDLDTDGMLLPEEAPAASEVGPAEDAGRASAPGSGRILLALGYLVLILACMVSVATMVRNPFNLVPVSLDQSPTVDAFRRLVSRNRIDQVDRALYVYFLEHQHFAPSLSDLVGEGVLSADAIVDPWGREYSYQILPQGYRVLGFDNGGVEEASLSRTRRFPTGLLP